MASGDVVVSILEDMPPATSYATMDTRAGGSTPAESVSVYDFDASASEYMDFKALLAGYDGGGITFHVAWTSTSGTSSNTRWEIAIHRLSDDADDIDTAHTYDFNGVSAPAPSAAGEVVYDTVAFTDGADMDSWADGEIAVVRIYRDHDHADDGMTGDAELVALWATET